MDKDSQAALDAILAKTPADLTENEWGFLKARASYLTPDQAEAFGLGASEPAESAPAPKRTRKSAPQA